MTTEPERVERFAAHDGQVTGVLGLGLCAAVVVTWAVDTSAVPRWLVAGALVAAVLVWAASFRPRVSVEGDTLVLRNMLTTTHVPLAAIDKVVVRQVLAVFVGERRIANAGVGRSRRQAQRRRPVPGALPAADEPTSRRDVVDVADHVETRLAQLVQEERTRLGLRRGSPELEALAAEVRTEPARLELALLAAALVLLVVALLV
ncbi:hypothetical protein [Nocardioides sp. SYSU D00038]|uniref:hypothetical protein n=1 Tax=Nocardioides sp. SYSU D00038 TaxID=2812554 RepID=UPI00196843C1|nr:hypothetical protein [Nocardioides sp. SYSU D00038]